MKKVFLWILIVLVFFTLILFGFWLMLLLASSHNVPTSTYVFVGGICLFLIIVLAALIYITGKIKSS